MKLVKQTLLSASCWCFILGLAFMWNPQMIQAETSVDKISSMESNGKITGFLINKQNGSALMHLANGATFCESDFPNDIRIRTTESGNHQSLKFTITGPGGTWTNTENYVTYDSKQFWPTPGNYTVKAELYSHDNLGGTRYDRKTITFTVNDCNAIPSLNCNNGDFVWEGSTRLIYSSNTMESYNLPSVFNNATSVIISEVLATDSYANRNNVTQADEELKLVFRRNGNVTGMSDYTPDLQDRVVTGIFQGSLPTVQLNGGADQVLVIHPGNSQFGRNITNSPNSLDINGLCLNAVVDPCANAGGDNDGDGVCNNDDCRPNNPNISSPGDACNDGNANTTNDVIQGDCTCAGTPVGPTFDCPALGANIGDACNDGNANTSNDVVQANCTCAGTPNPPAGCNATYSVNGRVITVSNLTGAIKAVKIIDNQWNTLYSCDDWGTNPCGGTESYTVPSCGTYSVQIQTYADWSTQICNLFETFQVDSDCGATVDCPALNANIGDACNDGNPNTNNDHVQANCTCAGTPVGPTFDCPALGANIGDACNDGNPNTNNDVVTANCSCAGTPVGPTTCDATYRVEGNKIIIEGLNAAINTAKILTSAWVTESECSDWTTACNGMLMATVPNGSYYVQIQTYADWSTPLCDIFEEVTVGSGGPTFDCPALGANIGDACNDGNPNTNNDVVTANCSCAGTPVGPTTCDATYRVEGDKIIIEGLDAAINTAKILTSAWATVAECSDWATACNGMLMATVPNGDYFVQIQTYADWNTPLCDVFEEVTVSGGSGGCDNVTNGGSIAGNETVCSGESAGMITSSAAPSGGSGAVEYLWLSSTTGCPRSLNQAIDGANGATYNPGVITQTTYYVRCSRRAGCDVWTAGESNCVTKTVDNNCTAGECANRTATNTKTNCGTGESYGFYANNLVGGISEGARYSISNANFVEFTDGTARYTARATSNDNAWVRWDIDITFSGRTSTAPTGSPKVNNCHAAGNDYYYYTSTNGTLTGRDEVAGAKISVTRNGEAFQVGTGANLQEGNRFGASGWLAYTVTRQPNKASLHLNNGVGMDINIRLDGSPTACNTGGPTFDCPALGANVGDACNDGNPNTNNDQVQADCSCAGTPTGGGACNLAITSGADFIQVSGVVGTYPTVGISDDFGNVVYQCHAFNGGCPTTIRVDGLAPGVYWVNARVVDSDWVTVLCEAAEDPVVGGGARVGSGEINVQEEKQSFAIAEVAPDFKVYPNPASEAVNVSLDGYFGKDVTIQMIDYTGRPLKSIDIDNVETTSYTIPIDRMSNGIYTVRVLSQGIKPIGKKMIVNKQF